jgi:hypothetical protein
MGHQKDQNSCQGERSAQFVERSTYFLGIHTTGIAQTTPKQGARNRI